eukprot:snap_masked-scaffold1746_size29152-processed-gene-0.2 protein:Tk04498 transcript:snap_masked-scaffold1746_size29152-processed-gene-0.2-mRNA-1 annotation:"hypothetical protein"
MAIGACADVDPKVLEKLTGDLMSTDSRLAPAQTFIAILAAAYPDVSHGRGPRPALLPFRSPVIDTKKRCHTAQGLAEPVRRW